MGENDVLTKEYLSDKERFAELFNTFVFHEGSVDPKRLIEEDTNLTETSLTFQRQRDILKSMSDGKRKMILLGVENQTKAHRAMPIRIMEYDALTYRKQVEEKAKTIAPVITLVLYWGSDPWKGPRSLSEMMDPELREKYRGDFEDYRIRIISPSEISKEELSSLSTDLRLVLQAVKYSKDKEGFNRILKEDEGYRCISRKTADLINVVTRSKLVYNEEEENVDMCQAIDEMMEDAAIKASYAIVRDFVKSDEEAYELISSKCGKSIDEVKKVLN